MDKSEPREEIREAVGVYFTTENLQKAVAELQREGVNSDDIELVSNQTIDKPELASLVKKINGPLATRLSSDVAQFRKRTSGEIVKAVFGGFTMVVVALMGAMVVTILGVLGSPYTVFLGVVVVILVLLVAAGLIIRKPDEERLKEQLELGHLLLVTRVRDADKEGKVLELLGQHSGLKPRFFELGN